MSQPTAVAEFAFFCMLHPEPGQNLETSMNKIVSASLDRIEYSSRGFLFAGPLPVNKGGLFYMSSPSVVMPKTASFYSEGSQIDFKPLSSSAICWQI